MIIRQYSIDELLRNGRDFDFFSSDCQENKKQAARTLAANGVYQLPLTDSGTVIWGFCALGVLEGLKVRDVSCRDISGENFSLQEKLKQALLLENRKNDYSLREKEKIYCFIREKLGGECREEILALVQDGGSFLQSAAQFSSLTGILRELAADEKIDLKTAVACQNIPDESLRLLEPYLIPLSFSRRRMFLADIPEIIKGNSLDNREIYELLERIASDRDPSSAVERMRRPGLSKTAAAFDAFCSSLSVKSGLKLKHPANFEGEYFSAEFSFRSARQLGRIIDVLTEIRDRCDELFRLL